MGLSRRANLALVILCVFCACVAMFAFRYHRTLFQEGNPFGLAVGIADAYLSDTGVGRIPGLPERYIARSGDGRRFWLFMERRGWTAVDQMGGELILENKTQGMFVHGRMWTTHFMVFEIRETVDKATNQSYNWSRVRDFFPARGDL